MIFSRKSFFCAALTFLLALAPLGAAGGTRFVPDDPALWRVSVGSLDVMGASEVRVTVALELSRPRSADLDLKGFVKGTTEVRLVPGQKVVLELTGKVLASDLSSAAIRAVRCAVDGHAEEIESQLPEDGLKLGDMSGYALPGGPKPSPEFMKAASSGASRGEGGGCDVGLAWTALLLVVPLLAFERRG